MSNKVNFFEKSVTPKGMDGEWMLLKFEAGTLIRKPQIEELPDGKVRATFFPSNAGTPFSLVYDTFDECLNQFIEIHMLGNF